MLFRLFCGDIEIRTLDPLLAKQVLYQLSYDPKTLRLLCLKAYAFYTLLRALST